MVISVRNEILVTRWQVKEEGMGPRKGSPNVSVWLMVKQQNSDARHRSDMKVKVEYSARKALRL